MFSDPSLHVYYKRAYISSILAFAMSMYTWKSRKESQSLDLLSPTEICGSQYIYRHEESPINITVIPKTPAPLYMPRHRKRLTI